MAAESADQSYFSLLYAVGGVIAGAVFTAVGNLFQSRASMAALVDARIKLIIETYEHRIEELQDKVSELQDKVNAMTAHCKGCFNFPDRREGDGIGM